MAVFTKTGKCKVCGINLYEETEDQPNAKKAMPCGIGPGRPDEEQCPFETVEAQARNAAKYRFERAGDEATYYLGGTTL